MKKQSVMILAWVGGRRKEKDRKAGEKYGRGVEGKKDG